MYIFKHIFFFSWKFDFLLQLYLYSCSTSSDSSRSHICFTNHIFILLTLLNSVFLSTSTYMLPLSVLQFVFILYFFCWALLPCSLFSCLIVATLSDGLYCDSFDLLNYSNSRKHTTL